MIVVGYTTVINNFKEYCNKAVKDSEIIIINYEYGGNLVLLSESEYNNLLENLHVRKSSRHYNELVQSIEQLKKVKIGKENL